MKDRRRGVLYAVAGGVFWGGSGVAGQYLLQDAGFATEWLVTARLMLAGLILLALVENMSYFKCPDCGKVHHIFGKSHAEEIAKKYGIGTYCQLRRFQ